VVGEYTSGINPFHAYGLTEERTLTFLLSLLSSPCSSIGGSTTKPSKDNTSIAILLPLSNCYQRYFSLPNKESLIMTSLPFYVAFSITIYFSCT
jgi:hypothetical protein